MAFFLFFTLLLTGGHWATAREVADYLQIDIDLLYRRWRLWGLPGAMIGGQVRFDSDEIEEWLEKRKAAERRVGRKS